MPRRGRRAGDRHTAIGWIDEAAGELRYRGHPVDRLAGSVAFLDAAYLLLHGALPGRRERSRFGDLVRSRRALPAGAGALLTRRRAAGALPALQALVASLGATGAAGGGDRDVQRCATLLGCLPTAVAVLVRQELGLQPVAPDPSLDHAANFLAMIRGRAGGDPAAGALDTLMVTYAEHELSPSTVAARGAVAAGCGFYEAVAAAIAELGAPAHGGELTAVMRRWLDPASPAGLAGTDTGPLPGFGHSLYTATDPRVAVLRRIAAELFAAGMPGPSPERFAELERRVHERRGAQPNVHLYGGAVLGFLGVPAPLAPAVMLASRAAGWAAHVAEEGAHRDRARGLQPRR